MACDCYKVSAPGKLMILGEHAVLHGRLALVGAINRRLTVTLTPTSQRMVRLTSALGTLHEPLDDLVIASPFQFVIAAIHQQRQRLPSGFDLQVESALEADVGLGSSAAVTVATAAALRLWLGEGLDREVVFDDSLTAVRLVQGRGSGADVAASVYGGLVAYRQEPRYIQKLDHFFPITAVHSGGKEPTPAVIEQVESRRRRFPGIYDHIFNTMDASVKAAVAAVREQNWPRLGQLLDLNHGLMNALGVGSARLDELAYALRADPGIVGAKISGSGLGDCVIGLGTLTAPNFPHPVVPVQFAGDGVRVESVPLEDRR